MMDRPAYSFYPHAWVIFLYRMGLGARLGSPERGYPMVLTTLAAGTSFKHPHIVNYAWGGYNRVYVAPAHERVRWYTDLKSNAYAEVWIGRELWAGRAYPVPDLQERSDAYRKILQRSGPLVPPLVGFNPHLASDDMLRAASAAVPVMRIQLEHQLPGGGGDLRWLLPLGLIAASVIWLVRLWANNTE
ncbi:MAG TPA: hypothetical protein VHP83_17325 [Aggregatilineaceae bacterium]|nr:hypothetical protein [Aggregatilineaceae bacterium]